MALDDLLLTPDDAKARLHDLFEAAKEGDEFEFACTLLRVRGTEDVGLDPFVETSRLVEDLTALILSVMLPSRLATSFSSPASASRLSAKRPFHAVSCPPLRRRSPGGPS
ncbi:MAG: hypothetical protein JJE35_14310 [Thermoleophilia bacterium]|nr:hypothetical protein [Thermoleophilia bacterium]